MSLTRYEPKTLDFFYHPCHVGDLDTSQQNVVTVRRYSPTSYESVKIQAQLSNQILAKLRFRCRGGVVTIAVCEYICHTMETKDLEKLARLTCDQIAYELAIPQLKKHRVLWVVETFQRLWTK